MYKKCLSVFLVIILFMSSFSFAVTETTGNVELFVGETFNLKTKVLNESNITSSDSIQWQNSNSSNVSINSSGVITARERGSATITAFVTSGSVMKEYSVDVKVLSTVKDIEINEPNQTIFVGQEVQLTYEIFPVDDLTTSLKTGVTWKSSNTDVLTVSSSGKIKGVGDGSAAVYLIANDGKKTDYINVTVKSTVTGIEFNKSVEKIYVGETITPSVNILPADAYLKDYTIEIQNGSSYIDVIDGEKIKGVKEGQGYIKATSEDGSYFDFTEFEVFSMVEGLSLNAKKVTLDSDNKTFQLTVTFDRAFENLEPLNKNIRWEVVNSGVVSVNSNGLVTAKSSGLAQVSAISEDGGYKASCNFEVKLPTSSTPSPTPDRTIDVDEFVIEDLPRSMVIGEKYPLEYEILPEDATNQSINFDVNLGSDNQVFKEDGQYYFRPIQSGPYVIDATLNGIQHTIFTTVKNAVEDVEILTSDLNEQYGRYQVYLGQRYTLESELDKVSGVSDIYLDTVTWSSDNKNVVKINSTTGEFTVEGYGQAKITVETKDGGFTDEITLEVIPMTESIETESKANIPLNTAYRPLVKFIPFDDLLYGYENVINQKFDITIDELYINEDFIKNEIDYLENKIEETNDSDEVKEYRQRLIYYEIVEDEISGDYARIDDLSITLEDRLGKAIKVAEIKSGNLYGYINGKVKLKVTPKDTLEDEEKEVSEYIDVAFEDGFNTITRYDAKGNLFVITEDETSTVPKEYIDIYKDRRAADIPSDGYLEDVEVAKSYGLVNESMDNNFREEINRLEFAKFIINFFEVVQKRELKDLPYLFFSDTNSQEANKAYNYGIVSGVGNRQFLPNQDVTRQELAVMIVRTLRALDQELPSTQNITINNKSAIASWAQGAVQQLVNHEILELYQGNFEPNANITKERAIRIIKNVYEELE